MPPEQFHAAGFCRATKVYVTKHNQPPMIIPACWVRIQGDRVDMVCEQPFDFVQTPVLAMTASFDRCLIGWEELPE